MIAKTVNELKLYDRVFLALEINEQNKLPNILLVKGKSKYNKVPTTYWHCLWWYDPNEDRVWNFDYTEFYRFGVTENTT